MLSIKRKYVIASISLLFLSVIFNFFSIKNILFEVYRWHLVQPETIQGGFEIIVLLFCMIVLNTVFNLKQKTALVANILIVLIYLKLHQVLLPVLTAFIYIEIIFYVGRTVLIKLKKYQDKDLFSMINSFVVGFSIWSICTLVVSLLGQGTFCDLRVLTLVLLFISIIFNRKLSLISYNLFVKFHSSEKNMKIGSLFIWVLVLIQFAKSNSALDYDSIWYGLRPEQVLIGPNSFFDSLGLSMYVHYYPKLFELFLVPISNLGDHSFIYAGTTIFLFLLYLLIYLFFKSVNFSKKKAILYTGLLASIPAIANMASTAKTDIFTTFFIVLVGYYLFLWIYHKSGLYFILSLCVAFISFGGKLTSYLYVPLLYIGFLIAAIVFKKINKPLLMDLVNVKKYKMGNILLLVSILIWLLVCYRTLKLTGYPVYPVAGSLWEFMGFDLKYPLITDVELLSTKLSLFDMVLHWTNIIFNPAQYTHYIMVWPSNLYVFLFLATLIVIVLFKNRIKSEALFLFISLVPVMVAVVYYVTTIPKGGDGNYFIGPIILCSIAFLNIIDPIVGKVKYFQISLILFLIVQTSLMFVSHFSWSYGTGTFNADLTKTDFDSAIRKEILFKQEGLWEIEQYLKKNNNNFNCLGFGKEQTLNELSCRFEDVPHINSRYGNYEIIKTKENFLEYVKWANVKYFIMPYENVSSEYKEVMKVIKNYELNPDATILKDNMFYLIDISNVAEYKEYKKIDNDEYTKYLEGWYEPESNNARWMSKQSRLELRTGEKGTIVIEGQVPEVYSTIDIDIKINDKVIETRRLEAGAFNIKIDSLPIEQEVVAHIALSDYFVPKDLNLNVDERELGIYVTNISVE